MSIPAPSAAADNGYLLMMQGVHHLEAVSPHGANAQENYG